MTSRPDDRPLSRRARVLSAAAAILTGGACLMAALAPFYADGRTPWFRSERAVLVGHCPPAGAPTQRHACLQAAAGQATATRVAAR